MHTHVLRNKSLVHEMLQNNSCLHQINTPPPVKIEMVHPLPEVMKRRINSET